MPPGITRRSDNHSVNTLVVRNAPYDVPAEFTEQQRHLWEYVGGLFSDVKRKSAETIAYFHDQDRQALQKFIGQSLWDDGLLIRELSRQVGVELGEPDGVLVFDPSGFTKQGKESVGVARQWCGRLGKIEECLERAKSDAGLAQYQVRNWIGWQHHQTLSLLAVWFLTQEDRRGKKIHSSADGADGSHDPCRSVMSHSRLWLSGPHRPQQHPPFTAERTRLCLPLEIT